MARSITTTHEAGITIQGLNEFSRALKATGAKAPAAMKAANRKVALRLVVAARTKAASLRGVARKASMSLRVSVAANYAAVAGGGRRWPYFYGAEFGSKRYKQFESWRGNQWGGWSGGPGYFLNPSIREQAENAIQEYWDEVDEITRDAFPD